MYDCVSIGDCTLDVNLTIHDANVSCDVNRENCQLNLGYGEKIPVDKLGYSLGGNACNNVVGIRRLGVDAGLFSVVGSDETGNRIKHLLELEGIDGSLVQTENGAESRYSTVINFRGEKTILDFVTTRKYALSGLPETNWFFLSSVGPDYERFFTEVAEYVKQKNIRLAFAPSATQLAHDFSTYRDVLCRSNLVFLNKQEAQRMVGGNEIKELLKKISDLGVGVVVITDAKNGSYVFDGKKYWHLGILDNLPVIQAVGAGDAFASGFLAATIKNLPVPEAMRWGTVNAGSVMGKMGAQAGLLTEPELDKLLTENPDFQPEEI